MVEVKCPFCKKKVYKIVGRKDYFCDEHGIIEVDELELLKKKKLTKPETKCLVQRIAYGK